jgi:AcrR family transcriptional regulator
VSRRSASHGPVPGALTAAPGCTHRGTVARGRSLLDAYERTFVNSAMRDEIFRQALELFSEKGYAGTSMRELAKRCGTTASNVYNYFPSKEDLLREVFRVGAEQIQMTLDAGRSERAVDSAQYLSQVLRTIDENRLLWKMIHQLRLNDDVRALLDADFTALLEGALGDLSAYCREPWLLLAIVDGVTASRLQGLPLPADEEVIRTILTCLEGVNDKA